MENSKTIFRILLTVLLGFMSLTVFAQNPSDDDPVDPGAVSVTTVQNMNFGVFFQGTGGGTVILSNTGSRTTTGSVVGLNSGPAPTQAMFDIEAPVGTIITVINGANSVLTNGTGGTITLQLGPSSPASPFSTVVAPPGKTTVHVGGTLTVGGPATSPPGNYSGTFYITFHHQ